MLNIRRFVIIIPLAIFALALPALGADYLPKNTKDAGNVTVSGPEEYKNLYVGGGNIAISKEILGDLFAAGGSINIFGPVEKDLFIVGGNINLSSPVGEDMRAAGGNITIASPVGGDLLIAGGTISINKNADIGGDLWGAGGLININSNIAGNTKIAGGEIVINGAIEGDVEVWADEKLIFGPESRVSGTITHYGRREAIIQEGAQVGTIDFRMTEEESYAGIGKFLTAFFFIKIAALLIAALILLRLFGKTSHSLITTSLQNPWKSLGIGFLGMIVIPLVAILLMVTVIGFYAGILFLLWFIFAMLMAGVFAVLLIGSLLERWIMKKEEVELSWQTALWGVFAGGVLTLIPFIGWLIMFIFYLISFGALLQTVKERLEL